MVPSVSLLTGFGCIFVAKTPHRCLFKIMIFILYLLYLFQEAKAAGVEKGDIAGRFS